MEFLRKVKGREPRDASNSRRIDAYRETVNRAIKENPEYLRQIEKDFEEGTSSNSNQIEKIIESTDKITSNLDDIQSKTAEVKAKQALDSQQVVENLTKARSINQRSGNRLSRIQSKFCSTLPEYCRGEPLSILIM